MKTRYKVLLTILAAVAYWAFVQHLDQRHAPARVQKCAALKVWYDEYNDRYFDSKLPQNTVVDYGEYNNDFIATTSQFPDGKFHIAFNEKLSSAPRVAHLFLLHEMCHVRTWDGSVETDHGPRWRTCMLNLDLQGAFKNELVYAYDK